MSKVGIVTDSASCLPPELVSEYNIHVAPVTLIINGKPYRDQVDISPDEFYKIQKNPKTVASTSGIPPGIFVDIFREAAQTTDKILCLPHSGSLGVTCDAVMQAREMVLPELPGVTIEVIDTRTAAGAQGLIALETARAAQSGKSLSEVMETAQGMIPRAKWLMALETLTYLIRGGRAPKLAGTIGNMLQMKPVIGMMNGSGAIDFSDKVRTSQRAIARLVEIVGRQIEPGKPAHFIVHYSDNIEKGERLKATLASEFNCQEIYMSQVTPMVSCQTGPMVGLSFYC